MGALITDFRYALRSLRKSPGFTAVAVATLALGIGVNVAIFSVVRSVLLRPLPFGRPDRLVALVVEDPASHQRGAYSPAEFLDYRRGTTAFSRLAASAPWNANLTGFGPAERLRGLRVTPNFFAMLGLRAQIGRTLVESDGRTQAGHVVVVSDRLWRRRFGADRGILDRQVDLNGEPYVVVGVAEPGFTWGRAYGHDAQADLWVPFVFAPAGQTTDERRNEFLDAIGRLRDGVSIGEARRQVEAVTATFGRLYPDLYPAQGRWDPTLLPLHEERVRTYRSALLALAGAVGLVLLIAVLNIAGLSAARAAARGREIAIRTAVGAAAGPLMRQFLTESVVLALIGGAAGAGIAFGALPAVRAFGPASLPGLASARIDGFVLLFALAASVGTGIAFGMAPALQARRLSQPAALRASRGSSPDRSSHRLRRALVVLQLGVALPVLAGAALLVVSLRKVLGVEPGFDPSHVLSLEVSLPSAGYADRGRRAAFYDDLERRVSGLPGVESVGAVDVLPLGEEGNSSSFEIEGHPTPPGEPDPHAEAWCATPGYFRALGVRLRRGRLFEASDRADSAPVVLIDEALARRYFGTEDPIGHRIDFEGGPQGRRWRTIIGVVGSVRSRSLDQPAEPQLYAPHSQRPARQMFLVVKSNGDPAALAAPIRRILEKLDPSVAAFHVAPLERVLAGSLAPRRFAASLLSLFGVCAVLLTAIGIYGVTAQWAGQRVREIGIRMALGARPAEIRSLVTRQSAELLAAGMAAGLAVSIPTSRLLRSQLFGVTALDAPTYAAVCVSLTLVTLAAAALPARRAARLDPMEALRHE
jgi:predicted permease